MIKKHLFFLFFALFLTGCEEKRPPDHMVIGTCADYPPFEFYQNGTLTGLEIELIQKIMCVLGKKGVIKDLPFESLIGSLYSGRIDMAISALAETPERSEKMDFSIPYHESCTAMLVKENSSIKNIEDLANQTIGVQLGTTYEAMVTKHWLSKISNLKVRSLAKVPDLLQDLKSGRLAAIIIGIGEGNNIAKEISSLKVLPIEGIKAQYAIAFLKGSPLIEPVNHLIKKWRLDGTLLRLEEKWISK